MQTPTKTTKRLPGKLADLISIKAPIAISNEKQYHETLAIVDRLMVIPKLTQGQSVYLETLLELVQYYESKNHAIDTSSVTTLELLKMLMGEHEMNASDLARLLKTHVSLGSKILKGERSLTIDHIKILSQHFHVSPLAFIN